jgi:hypothetical protein
MEKYAKNRRYDMKTVVFGINHFRKLYWNDVNIVFFDNKGWWIKKEEEYERKFYNIKKFKINFQNLPKDIKTIPNELMQWLPIWARWYGKGDQYELIIREAYIQILYIQEGLRQLNISNAIFQTAVSHHIPTVIFEIACIKVNIRPIFTYMEPITQRYVMMQHTANVKDREALKYKTTSYQSTKSVNDFINNKRNNKIPKSHGMTSRTYDSFIYGILYLVFRKNLSMIKHFFEGRIKKDLNNTFFSSYPFQEYFQMLQQYKASAFLKKNIDSNIKKDKNKPKLLIAAHRQPESTSFPEGWGMSTHTDLVVELRRLGYVDDIIYKEHFTNLWYTVPILGTTRVGMYRDTNYFENLLELGCKFIDINYHLTINSNENNWYLPVTITGTIALERSLAGFRTIVTGYPWYKGLPGIIHINDITSLEKIPLEWLEYNSQIERNAKIFINNLLSDHTILNIHDMDNGNIATVSNEDLKEFKEEFDKFLLYLNKDN